MIDWKKTLIAPEATIQQAIQTIDSGQAQIAIVVDGSLKLLGTVTDGDVRRGILKGIALSAPVEQIMRKSPVVVPAEKSREEILAVMKRESIHQVPIVDRRGRIVRVEVLDNLIEAPAQDNWIILMAGGLGTRLKPLTEDCPKPLLKIGNKPLLETILENLIAQGFKRFFLAVNYKNEMVRSHFGDGSQMGVEIEYLREDQRLGTAGALGMLSMKPKDSFLVMNADLLTKINFRHLLAFHAEHEAEATMGVREYSFQVPYGVVDIKRSRVVKVSEKPVKQFFVNAGIYAFEPGVLKLVRKNEPLDMPVLFERIAKKKFTTAAFPIREYWLDIGQMEDFVRANGDFALLSQ